MAHGEAHAMYFAFKRTSGQLNSKDFQRVMTRAEQATTTLKRNSLNIFRKFYQRKAPAKRSQHANATYHNIVGRNMLPTFSHRVATCWVLLAQI